MITERNVPVARFVPLDDSERKSTRRLRLTRSGLLKPGGGKRPANLKRPPIGDPSGPSAVDALLAERQSDER